MDTLPSENTRYKEFFKDIPNEYNKDPSIPTKPSEPSAIVIEQKSSIYRKGDCCFNHIIGLPMKEK